MNELIGTSVMADYANNRMHRIIGIDFSKTPRNEFKWESRGGRLVSYVEYYQERYRKTIHDHN